MRELQNVIERAEVLNPAGDLDVGMLPAGLGSAATASAAAQAAPPSLPPEGIDLYAVLGEMEDRLIREALDRTGGNRNQAARYLGLNRTTLVEKLRKLAKR